jgi:hypothetical protein
MGWVVTDGATATPAPVIGTVKSELSWALEKTALPEALPATVGAKLAVKVTLAPGFKDTGKATPVMLRPATEALT